MFKRIYLFACCATPLGTAAQIDNPNLQSMVNTEEAFMKKAEDYNTRDAFLFFLSDDAVTAGPNGPVVGKAELKKQKPNESLLSWRVAFCDISSSGDFGYNTGPWEFRSSKKDSVATAFGEFHSIWRKQPDGVWKNHVDIGIQHPAPTEVEELKTSSKPLTPPIHKTPSVEAITSLMKQENTFIENYKKNGLAAYAGVVSAEIRFTREGELPIVTPRDKAELLKRRRHPYFNPKLVDGGIAASGDMGYTYGTMDASTFVDNKQETKVATYLRVWKKEDGKNWKIVVDVISYR